MKDCALPCVRTQSDSHLVLVIHIFGAKRPPENLPLRLFVTPGKRVVEVVPYLFPYSNSFTRKAQERASRDKSSMKDLGRSPET